MADLVRCGVCGVPHPHLVTCPFIAEQAVEQFWEGSGKQRRLVSTIMRTRYFERPEVFAGLVQAQEDDEPDTDDGAGEAVP